MKKLSIIYWSSTGNTEKIAKGIYDGIQNKNMKDTIEVNMLKVSEATIDDIKTSDLIVLGCSAMGVEEIDTSEMAPFINSISEELSNKNISLFGSYDWGDGQWLEEWQTEMENLNANIITENFMIQTSPDADELIKCNQHGEALLKLILNN